MADASGSGSGSGGGGGESIASSDELEAWARLPVPERKLEGPLRGVLAETALTGVIRYPWALVRPLVEFAMEQVGQAGGG
jgi:hypothetical protein